MRVERVFEGRTGDQPTFSERSTLTSTNTLRAGTLAALVKQRRISFLVYSESCIPVLSRGVETTTKAAQNHTASRNAQIKMSNIRIREVHVGLWEDVHSHPNETTSVCLQHFPR